MGRKQQTPLSRLNRWWLRYEYKHTSLALLFIVIFTLLVDSAIVAALLGFIEGLGYIGAFIAGVLSVSFFTAVPAIVLLVSMADGLDPFALAVVAGGGAMVGDWLLLMLFQERIADELRPLIHRFKLKAIAKKLRRKYTKWVLFVVGAVSVMTPSPDELGIALLGISHFRRSYLLVVCFVLDTIGFLALVGVVRLLT